MLVATWLPPKSGGRSSGCNAVVMSLQVPGVYDWGHRQSESIYDHVDTAQTGGHGLQVINILNATESTPRYEVNVDNLRALLLREDVADRPVAVVSIAGPYRGGKSFLLDFFLRYLKASRSQQQSGKWLGGENEPLAGFHWRGGSKRDTTGIHMWSEPFHIKLEPSGEEVAVLLMDTQGTFDSKSTLQDSTTIFALSTLLSSVQIYNLFRNIDETDLHHLQLFTDYGLKVNANSTAFQELMFLIRDWPNSYEYEYGYNGGKEFLTEVLKIQPDQIPELRGVREHIHRSFAKLTCFLMPHPGLKVASKNFSGYLADIDDDFKYGLIEMIPTLFSPEHLTPKLNGGQMVTGRDLMAYFYQYARIFNSKTLPDVMSIVEGTKAASILAATTAAHHEYDVLTADLDVDDKSFTNTAIRATHELAREAAIRKFNSKTILIDRADSELALNNLKKDFEHMLRSRQYNNNIKLRSAIRAAKDVYNQTLCGLLGVQNKQTVCVHPLDLERFHQEALASALATFDSFRQRSENETDEEKTKLNQAFIEDYGSLRSLNINNNEDAVQEAHSLYLTTMSAHRGFEAPAELSIRHINATTAALRRFTGLRNRPTNQTEDRYHRNLLQNIESDYEDIKNNNVNPNKILLNKAEQMYNEQIKFHWRSDDSCYHPQALKDLHQKARNRSIEEFLENCVPYEKDMYLAQLNNKLLKRYNNIEETNEYNNAHAVEEEFEKYITAMDRFKAPSNFIDDTFKKFSISSAHASMKAQAITMFEHKCVGRDSYPKDKHLLNLERKIDAMFSESSSFWSTLSGLAGVAGLLWGLSNYVG